MNLRIPFSHSVCLRKRSGLRRAGVAQRIFVSPMSQVWAIIIALGLALTANADELRMARFDVKRVFDEYQHTKDLMRVALGKTNFGGPHSITPSMDRSDRIKERHDKLLDLFRASAAGSSERERLDLQLQISSLERQLDEVRRTLEETQRERTSQDEAMKQRSDILTEIWSAAARLGAERGYLLLIPDYLPTLGPFPILVAPGASDDLTEQLLTRLNEEYAAKKSK
jgi:hypothetical protein